MINNDNHCNSQNCILLIYILKDCLDVGKVGVKNAFATESSLFLWFGCIFGGKEWGALGTVFSTCRGKEKPHQGITIAQVSLFSPICYCFHRFSLKNTKQDPRVRWISPPCFFFPHTGIGYIFRGKLRPAVGILLTC